MHPDSTAFASSVEHANLFFCRRRRRRRRRRLRRINVRRRQSNRETRSRPAACIALQP
jgi:hypothetical protein